MSYVIQATLSNPDHPEFGVATIPFPISNGEYEQTLKLLDALNAGDAVKQDCFVKEIDSSYEVLRRLIYQVVNVDELDYLAKRLDSFDVYEAAQFQAACAAFDCKDIKDFINMAFCCKEVTVISDFSKLEEAGQQHYLTTHGGSVPADEMSYVDGKGLAERLIRSGEGKPTPHGLFFRNGMRMGEQYRGRGFPPYLWNTAQAEMELTTPDGATAYIFLPTTELALERFQQREGIRHLAECQRTLRLFHSQGESMEMQGDMDEFREWNQLCERLDAMSEPQRSKFYAAVEVTGAEDLAQMQLLASSLGDFELTPGVKDAEGYGKYVIKESGRYDYKRNGGLQLWQNWVLQLKMRGPM